MGFFKANLEELTSGRYTDMFVDFSRRYSDMFVDFLGEFLRDFFFDQTEDLLGCYETFDTQKDVVSREFNQEDFKILFSRPYSPEEDSEYFKQGKAFTHPATGIKMCYLWDGDGVLGFYSPDLDFALVNGDCKYTRDWKSNPL